MIFQILFINFALKKPIYTNLINEKYNNLMHGFNRLFRYTGILQWIGIYG